MQSNVTGFNYFEGILSHMEERKQNLTPLQAKEKIKHYCAWSERSHSDVRNKLYNYGLRTHELEPIISYLIEENYLNEERYAIQFAGGHFRLKQWGRVKIIHALQAKGVSEYCIKKGLREIDEDLYETLLEKLAKQKWDTTRGQKPVSRWNKTKAFLLQRGFESNLVLGAVKKLQQGT